MRTKFECACGGATPSLGMTRETMGTTSFRLCRTFPWKNVSDRIGCPLQVVRSRAHAVDDSHCNNWEATKDLRHPCSTRNYCHGQRTTIYQRGISVLFEVKWHSAYNVGTVSPSLEWHGREQCKFLRRKCEKWLRRNCPLKRSWQKFCFLIGLLPNPPRECHPRNCCMAAAFEENWIF